MGLILALGNHILGTMAPVKSKLCWIRSNRSEERLLL